MRQIAGSFHQYEKTRLVTKLIPQTVVMVLSRTSPSMALAQLVACTDRLPTSCADAGCANKLSTHLFTDRP